MFLKRHCSPLSKTLSTRNRPLGSAIVSWTIQSNLFRVRIATPVPRAIFAPLEQYNEAPHSLFHVGSFLSVECVSCNVENQNTYKYNKVRARVALH